MPDFDLISSLAPTLVLLAGASERLVEAIKNMIPRLQVDVRGTVPQNAGTPNPITEEQERDNSWREAWIGLLSIAVGILTAWLAVDAGAFPKEAPTTFGAVVLYGLIIAGGTRLLNPIAAYLTEIKDMKRQGAAQQRAQTPRA